MLLQARRSLIKQGAHESILRTRATGELEMNSSVQRSPRWTVEDTRLAFYLYCQLPFGRLDQRTPEVIELARFLGRTPGAVAMKLSNFASLDPAITGTGRTGLRNVSSVDRKVWVDFHTDWAGMVEACETRLNIRSMPVVVSEVPDPYLRDDYTGTTRMALGQQRVSQDFFRRAILSTYGERCCMSGISEPRLLIASHIVSWADDSRNRLNPRNGLCLSALHDRAFDQHLVSLTEDMRILISRTLKARAQEPLIHSAFIAIEGRTIEVPKRFQPDVTLLAIHREKFFARAGVPSP